LLPQHTTAPQAFLQPYTQHKADFVAMLDWLITHLRKEKMQWIPSCCLALMLQIQMTTTPSSTTQEILYKMTTRTKWSCCAPSSHGMGSLFASGGAAGIGKLYEQ
jgi:hypothetical protein